MSFLLAASWYLIRHGRQYDIFHVHGAYLRIVPVVAVARLLGKIVVVKMTLQGSDDPASSAKRRLGVLLRWALERVDAVVSISSGHDRGLPRQRAPRWKARSDSQRGHDPILFAPSPPTSVSASGRVLVFPTTQRWRCTLGFVGRRKGADTLLYAWDRVLRRRPGAFLLLVGPLREDAAAGEPSMQTLVSRSARTLALGETENVDECLKASDVFVLPSRSEGLANALLEAMSTGLACIASNIAGMGDVIQDGRDGLLVPPGAPELLADSIAGLLEDRAKRSEFGRLARKKIVDGYSIDVVADRYAGLYQRLIAGRRRGLQREA